ncbi:uncharacterized protein I303_103802 [Kwoniella dejecticola CBS 10117]|uniref:Uncharacterized protein n=1 Tax=Kwoniella dejecticola CBS 10117 TaxID=1296121 RepID=A0A1A6A7S2_9TREE|nr:uncharacterized protein I303_03821 [Kwoniella dejecticola CBS 10117]OBR86102.1 hypothetical protein I303_03821 [Kwoniella dejecticola CBS 10117]
MTSLNPSHNPFSSKAQAVHHASSSTNETEKSTFPDSLPTVHGHHHHHQHQHQHQHNDHSDHLRARKEGRKRVKQNMPVMPDLRFEQSYLLSIRPYLTPHPTAQAIDKKGAVEKSSKPSGTLVTSAEEDRIFHWGRQVDVDWSNVIWVTLRDQVVSPLVQGALWGWATIFLATTGAVLRANLYPPTHVNRGRISGGPGGKVDQAGGGKAVGASGWWKNWVGSLFGGVQTATV